MYIYTYIYIPPFLSALIMVVLYSKCSVLHCFAVCCSVLQCVTICVFYVHLVFFERHDHGSMLFEMQFVAVCCSVLQCAAVCDDLCVLYTPRLF